MSRLNILQSTLDPPRESPLLGPAWAGTSPAPTEDSPDTRLIDAFGRRLTYLRVSVTDRCNLRCTYCLPEDADFPFGDRDFLSPAEIETMVGALVRLGIRRVRLTGGEPLVRKDLLEIVRRLKALPGLENLALSTNGTELARLAPALRGRRRPRQHQRRQPRPRALPRDHPPRRPGGGLARRRGGARGRARSGQAQHRPPPEQPGRRRAAGGPHPRPPAPRPLHRADADGVNHHLQPGEFVSADDTETRIEQRFGPLEPAELGPRTGPAKAYRFAGAVGTVGFITPLSHTFCADCNRLRLTSRGELRLCLFARHNYPLRPLLAAADPAAALESEILRVLQEKPAEHLLTEGDYGNLESFMQIGG